MSLLNFLQSSKVEEVVPGTRAGGPTGPRKQRQPNPSIVAVRLWRDGSVYPSTAAIAKFDLGYKDTTITKEPIPLKDGETVQKTKNVYAFPNGTGNGLDVVDSRAWDQFKTGGDGGMLFVVPTPKNAPKVDLFGTTNYIDNGKPKSTVEEQGAKTFGQDVLLKAVEELYGIVWKVDAVEAEPAQPAVPASQGVEARKAKPAIEAVTGVDGVEYVDLVIFDKLGDFNIVDTYSKKILHIPKRTIRGKDAGELSYVKRENAVVYGFAPFAAIGLEEPAEQKEEDIPTVESAKELDAALNG